MRRIFSMLALALPLAACGGGTQSQTVPTTYSGLSQQVFTLSCATSGCHSSQSPQDQLDLTTPNGYAGMVGQTVRDPNFAGTQWAGWPIVDPGHPEHSALVVVLEHPAGLPPILQMPTGATLSADKIAAIKTWITNGAKND